MRAINLTTILHVAQEQPLLLDPVQNIIHRST